MWRPGKDFSATHADFHYTAALRKVSGMATFQPHSH